MTNKVTSTPVQKNQSGLIPLAQAGALLMVSEHWIRDLSKKGYVPKPERGMIPLVPTVQGYIRWLKDEERRTSKTAEAAAVHRARAREIELRIAREQGQLVELADAEAVFSDVLGTWRTELAGLGAAVTRDLSLRQRINDHVEAAVARARNKFAEKRKALTNGTK